MPIEWLQLLVVGASTCNTTGIVYSTTGAAMATGTCSQLGVCHGATPQCVPQGRSSSSGGLELAWMA